MPEPSPAPKEILNEREYAALREKGFTATSRRNHALNKGGSVDIVSGGGATFGVVRHVKLTPEVAKEIGDLLAATRARETKSAEALASSN